MTVEQQHVVVAAATEFEREFTELVAAEDCVLASADVADRLPLALPTFRRSANLSDDIE
ncbi:hypothetical protein V1290_005404 [Bradyrhizobium sp. AZCC 1578]|uniref:hypothetical protein n=1 Tax=Bradyrhizobium sp. AZCC 1578 TaxID=3117027 RepID=UPI002FF1D52C